jgi:mRNA-degrading endonuclease YafQ of YafQ-DinJ toxin-antitoxin module
MEVKRTKLFLKTFKKLHKNQVEEFNIILDKLIENPTLGKLKTGQLTSIRVCKFSLVNYLTLLAYSYYKEQLILELLKVGPHENFYKDLENELKRSK